MAKKWTTADIPDQSGRVALITGANSGIGFESAKALADKGARVVLACRSVEKAEAAKGRIKGDVSVLKLDLADLSSVRAAAERFSAEHERLDLLINNAGAMVVRGRQTTADGFEMQFGTNHFGHFALTGLLLGTLVATDRSRIVSVSSASHRGGEIDLDALRSNDSRGGLKGYGDSKLANLLFANRLQRMLAEAGQETLSTGCHPGFAKTRLMPFPMRWALNLMAQGTAQGALPTLLAATDENGVGGQYYGPTGFQEMRGSPALLESSVSSHDTEMADRLWELSEELTGVTYEMPRAG